jgi:putative NADH-flavin reductase
MKLLVLGATGGTGVEIVRQAIERSHSITAFVRAPEELSAFRGRIKIISGDLLSAAELEKVARGHHAVLSAFGPRLSAEQNRSTFAVALTSAMLRTEVRRLVILSTAFLFRDSVIPPAYLVGRLFFKHAIADAAEMESVVRASGLDWTIVRPPRLTNKSRTGKYRAREGRLPRFGFTICRADVADFMIRAAENRTSVGAVVGVCN